MMGVSTNGIVAFGVALEEGVTLPWESDPDFDDDIETWWFSVNKYEGRLSPFTDLGEYAPGFSRGDPRIDQYFEDRRNWLKGNPLPIQLQNYCSDSCPMWAACVPDTIVTAFRGYLEALDFEAMGTPDATKLVEFLEKHEIEYEGQPGWLLMSYWG